MDLRQLRSFVAIVENSGFRAAADELHTAQPALSQQIRALEAELGVDLFDRSTRPVRTTDAGAHLFPRAQSILREVERAAAEVRDFRSEPRGRLAVGAMQYLTNLELPDLLAEFSRTHSLVELDLRVGATGQLCEGLQHGDTDVIICHADELGSRPDLATESLRIEELVVVVGNDDVRASRQTISIEELADASLISFRQGASIREALEAAFRRAGLVPRITYEIADMPTAVGLVARGLGAALIPRSVAEQAAGVTALSVEPDRLTRHVALVWRRDRHRSRALEAFRVKARAALRPADGSS